MATGWQDAGRARRAFAEVIEGLDDEQLDATTPCGSWTPRHILGHLTSFVDIGLGGFFATMARHRFDYDAAADTLARKMAERPVDDLLATLRANAEKKAWLPVFPEIMTVTDAVVHTQDVRRGVGLTDQPDEDLLRSALACMVTSKMARNLGGPKLDGLSFTATDLGWSSGSGASVEGTGEALLMAMTGRAVLDELSGDGVEQLRSSSS